MENSKNHCPECDSTKIDWGSSEPSNGFYEYEARCGNCGCDFIEIYRLEYETSETVNLP